MSSDKLGFLVYLSSRGNFIMAGYDISFMELSAKFQWNRVARATSAEHDSDWWNTTTIVVRRRTSTKIWEKEFWGRSVSRWFVIRFFGVPCARSRNRASSRGSVLDWFPFRSVAKHRKLVHVISRNETDCASCIVVINNLINMTATRDAFEMWTRAR